MNIDFVETMRAAMNLMRDQKLVEIDSRASDGHDTISRKIVACRTCAFN